MYFLDGCAAGLKPLFGLVNLVINAIMIGVPIVLIVLGMIDLGKAVIASKEDEVKKATKAFGKRFLYAVGVFAVVWLVTFVFDTVTKQAVCPPEFFESIRKINDAAELTESSKKVTSEDYLQKIIRECSKVIVNKSDITKRRTSKKK